MNEIDSRKRATEYCRALNRETDFDSLLGTGQEGYVWRTNDNSAIKVFDRVVNFDRELACYQILSTHQISDIDGFAVPEMLQFDSDLRVIEMSIVAAPYILDFGKCYVGRPPDFPPDVMEAYEREREEWFEGNWPMVQSALWTLETLGIFYNDARPGNIDCTGHPESKQTGL
ncbi:hypothetical protein Poly51_14810 [Rubripirellula tenax]|uniref:Phosphotransferase enzyme family protein n=1 Tax=Rubripirellula tenax TaxID=2528015 RepID=A0A5C6FGG1_9BACT|nr:hypothetical protein [Rubripirellula tenax]TWU58701.1 hypothetical protein Poly51_14810 [Rubripirellula tenax]